MASWLQPYDKTSSSNLRFRRRGKTQFDFVNPPEVFNFKVPEFHKMPLLCFANRKTNGERL